MTTVQPPMIQVPPRSVEQISIVCERPVSGEAKVMVQAMSQLVTGADGRVLPQPVPVQVPPLELLALLVHAQQIVLGEMMRAQEGSEDHHRVQLVTA